VVIFSLQMALAGVLGALVAAPFAVASDGRSWVALGEVIVLAGLVATSVVDLRERSIPSSVLGLTAAALAGVVLVGAISGGGTAPIAGGMLGSVAVAGLLMAARLGSAGGLGRGDLRLGALLGFTIGWQAAHSGGGAAVLLTRSGLTVLLASVAAVAAHLALGIRSDRHELPFAPALSCSAFLVLIVV
jgi:prepilin signal peptidase PulO-like enzyme (type II secretory pathway)